MGMESVMQELYLRFIVSLPEEEKTLERIGFNVEEAHWYYQDYVIERNRLLNPISESKFFRMFFDLNPHLLRGRSY
jgi:mRNA-decapping enzyme subunit 2